MKQSETSIKTERLWLRQIDETDAEAIVSLRSNAEIYKYFLNPVKLTVDVHKMWYKEQYGSDSSRIDWIAVDDETGEFIGVYGAKKAGTESVEVSYITEPSHKGCGYASEAVNAIIDWCIEAWNINIVIANIHCDNLGSQKFAAKNGFKDLNKDGLFIKMVKEVKNVRRNMKLDGLRKIFEYKHFGDFTDEELITSIELYNSIFIDTEDMRTQPSNNGGFGKKIAVSNDVKALHRFARRIEPIMLPCPYCGRTQVFNPIRSFRNLSVSADKPVCLSSGQRKNDNPDGSEVSEKMEQTYGDLSDRVPYSFGRDDIDFDVYNVLGDNLDFGRIKGDIAKKVIREIIGNYYDLRKEYVCSFDSSHRCFVEFEIHQAIDDIPDELLKLDQSEKNVDQLMAEKVREAQNLDKKLRFCLVARKVAQFPSMADILRME